MATAHIPGAAVKSTTEPSEVRNTTLTVVICIGSAFGIPYLLSRAGIGNGIPEGIATVCLGAHPIVHRALEEKRLGFSFTPSSAKLGHLVKLQSYELSPYLMLVSATLFLAALTEFLGLLIGIGVGMFGGVFASSGVMLLLIRGYVAFQIGRWIGVRCSRLAYLVAPAALLLAQVLGDIIDTLLVPAHEWHTLLGTSTSPSMVSMYASSMVIAVILAALATLGCWRGQARKLPAYASYLVRQLPKDMQLQIAHSTYAEVERLHPKKQQPVVTAPMATHCPHCGNPLSASAHFCGRCGTAISHT